jgi:hypothetical protein
MSARVLDDGEEVVVAVRSSTIFSCMVGRSAMKLSFIVARTRVAILRRLSCVFLSASIRAEVAPTPKTIPAVEGATNRDNNSGTLSLSVSVHCFSRGSQSLSTRIKVLAKNRGSLKASARSFRHDLCVFGSLES